jgi:hypothetical protein
MEVNGSASEICTEKLVEKGTSVDGWDGNVVMNKREVGCDM